MIVGQYNENIKCWLFKYVASFCFPNKQTSWIEEHNYFVLSTKKNNDWTVIHCNKLVFLSFLFLMNRFRKNAYLVKYSFYTIRFVILYRWLGRKNHVTFVVLFLFSVSSHYIWIQFILYLCFCFINADSYAFCGFIAVSIAFSRQYSL